MYMEFVLIRNGMMTDTEATAFERRVYYLQFSRGGRATHHARTTRRGTRVGQEAEGAREKHGSELLLLFSWGKNG